MDASLKERPPPKKTGLDFFKCISAVHKSKLAENRFNGSIGWAIAVYYELICFMYLKAIHVQNMT